MNLFIHTILIAILCIHHCSLDVGKTIPLRETNDFDLQERNYPDNVLHGNDYQKFGLTFDSENGGAGLKPIYSGMRNKFRMRRKPYKKRRMRGNMENRNFEYADLRNSLKHNVDEDKRRHFVDDEDADTILSEIPQYIANNKRLPNSKHWPIRRLKKLREFREKFGKDYLIKNEKETKFTNDIVKKQELPNEGYVLIPEDDQIIVVKNMTLTQANPEHIENEQPSEVPEQDDRKFIMTVQNGHPMGIDKTHEESEFKHKYKNKEAQDETQENDCIENNVEKNQEDLKKKLKEEILNCTTSGLNKYLKFFEKEDEDLKSSLKCSENSQAKKSDLMKLNISINGLIMNNNKPSQISGNGTIKFHPRYDDDRRRRALKIPFLTSSKKKDEDTLEKFEKHKKLPNDKDDSEVDCTTKPHKPGDPAYDGAHDPDMGLTPDKLSHEIVKMVSHMVNSNPEMKTLWPSLRYNEPTSKGPEYNLRHEANRNSHKQIEQMLRQTMATVNEIIQKEVQSRSCVPLSKDLAEFYEAILEMHAKQAKRKEEREELLARTESLDPDKDDNDESKKKTGKSKPKDGGGDDDDEELQNDTLYDMMHLRKLQFDKEMADARHRREAEKRNYKLMLDTADSSFVRKLRHLYSPAFLKLNSIAGNLQRTEDEAAV